MSPTERGILPAYMRSWWPTAVAVAAIAGIALACSGHSQGQASLNAILIGFYAKLMQVSAVIKALNGLSASFLYESDRPLSPLLTPGKMWWVPGTDICVFAGIDEATVGIVW